MLARAKGEQRTRDSLLDKALRIYAWFLLVVTALPAAARLARPRELAHILLMRYQDPKRRKRARIGGLIYLGLSLIAIPFLLRAPDAPGALAGHGGAGRHGLGAGIPARTAVSSVKKT